MLTIPSEECAYVHDLVRGPPTDPSPGRLWIQALVRLLLVAPAPADATGFTDTRGLPDPQGNTVYAIACTDAAHGWTVGGSGFVLRTLDGGVDGELQHGPLAVAPDLYDLVVTPSGALLACGTGNGIYRSIDVGMTWSSPRTSRPPACGTWRSGRTVPSRPPERTAWYSIPATTD